MVLKFTKMQALGNDFVVLDGVRGPVQLSEGQLRLLADRHFGVGCDQVLLVEPPRAPDTDFYYRIFNADGSEVEQCGNGARCLLLYLRSRGLTERAEVRLGTRAGPVVPRLEPSGLVAVAMGVPEFEPARIPFEAPRRALTYRLEVAGREREVSVLALGNPHAVQLVPDVERAPVASEGPLIERHPRFPRRVNAGYLQVLDRHRVRLRVYERGAGETLACGSGACAAAVAGIARGVLESPVTVAMRGGELGISWAGEGEPVVMSGPAAFVFEGEIEL